MEWILKAQRWIIFSKMFELETETRYEEVNGEWHRMETRSISQNFIRRDRDNDSRGMRAGSFVSRMIRVLNNMVPDSITSPAALVLMDQALTKKDSRSRRSVSGTLTF